MVRTEIEIAAPPSLVREIMLDFHNVSKWHDGKWVKSIVIETPGKIHGLQLVQGDKIHTTMPGMDLHQTILANHHSSMSWVGPWKGLLTGTSTVEFKESEEVNGGTRLVREEVFTGWLSLMMADWNYGGWQTAKGHGEMNRELKTYCEKVVRERKG